MQLFMQLYTGMRKQCGKQILVNNKLLLRLVTACTDQQLRIWNLNTMQCDRVLRTYGSAGNVTCVDVFVKMIGNKHIR
jgi:hypothetical protein